MCVGVCVCVCVCACACVCLCVCAPRNVAQVLLLYNSMVPLDLK